MSSTENNIASNLLALGSSNVIQRLFSLGSFLLLVRFLSLQEYGALNLLLSLAAPAFAIASLGLHGIVSTEVALARGREQFGRLRSIITEYFYLNLGLYILFALAVLLLRDYFIAAGWISSVYEPYIGLMLVYVFFHVFLAFGVMLLRSFERFTLVAIVESSETILRFLSFAGLYVVAEYTLVNVVVIYAAAKIGAMFMFSYAARSLLRTIREHAKAESGILFKTMRSYAKWSIAKSILAQFTESIRLWLIKLFISTEAVAIFSVASKAMSFITKVFPLSSVISPLIQRRIDDREAVQLIIKKSRKYYLIFYTASVITVFLFMRSVLEVIAPEYTGHMLVFYLLSLQLIVQAFGIGQSPLLFGHKRQRFLFLLFVVSFIVSNTLNVFFLYFFALPGLAIAVVVNSIVTITLSEYYIRSRFDYHLLSPKDYLRYDYYDQLIVGKIRGLVKKVLPL